MRRLSPPITRRHFLKIGTAIVGGGLLGACATPPATPLPSTSTPGSMMSSTSAPPTALGMANTLPPRTASPAFKPDLELTIKATPSTRVILPGDPTPVWVYEGSLVSGDPASLQTLPGSYLGPIIRARTGQKVRVNFVNALPDQPSIIHWHGLHLSEDNDAHPRFVIQPGQTYVYEFEILNRAGTYWFHPHTHGLTAEQVYRGLAGVFIVSDAEEAKVNLPTGTQDLPLVIQDRTFDAHNQFVYTGMSDMNSSMMGFLGGSILVNGQPGFVLEAATRAYRLRLLNGSNSRIYKLAWGDGTPLTVIGTDGGLLDEPVQRPYVMLAPGERLEVWADFSQHKIGDEVVMMTQKFEGAENPGGETDGSMPGMSGMDMGGTTTPPLGAESQVLVVRVTQLASETLSLPSKLVPFKGLLPADAINGAQPRPLVLTLNGMNWVINGRGFDMDEVADTVKMDTTEIWEIRNEQNPGAAMDANGMAHPIHVHAVQFQVLDRQIESDLKAGWDTVSQGFVDVGWKDTVLVMPGERVKLLMRFSDFTGKFLYHCHNLEHGDLGMTRNFAVVT